MQKVEGSNPFSRSKEKPRSGGAFLCPELPRPRPGLLIPRRRYPLLPNCGGEAV
jgi:hypothetical protein